MFWPCPAFLSKASNNCFGASRHTPAEASLYNCFGLVRRATISSNARSAFASISADVWSWIG